MNGQYGNGPVLEEGGRRTGIWQQLLTLGGPRGIGPSVLRELRIYGGAQGVWVDAERTRRVSRDEFGVTVGLLHKGTIYADDLGEDLVVYHYPHTNRPSRRDLGEIEATKNANRLGLPLFVIVGQEGNPALRDVRMGWVEDWDDANETFLVAFDAVNFGRPPSPETLPFELTEEKTKIEGLAQRRVGNQKFRFDLFHRYGTQCAVCDVDIPALLDGAHLMPWASGGADDPRNGLVLCSLHHRALDAGLFAIDPQGLAIHPDHRYGADDLRITRRDISHLSQLPHSEALQAVWERFTARGQ